MKRALDAITKHIPPVSLFIRGEGLIPKSPPFGGEASGAGLLIILFSFLVFFLSAACDNGTNPDSFPPLSSNSAKEIVEFRFNAPSAKGSIDEAGKTVNIAVPATANLTLIPMITVSPGARVTPASGVSWNFGSPATYIVTAADGSTAEYTVKVSTAEGSIGIDGVEDYLASTSAGNEIDSPVQLKVILALADDWAKLLDMIQAAGKYAALDLSACTGDTEFDPGLASAGESNIVSLLLPDTVIRINNSRHNDIAQYFPFLKSVEGRNVEAIDYAVFRNCTVLESADFPKVVSIGIDAFFGCASLESADFPEAASIGDLAFSGCASLATVNFPEAVFIGNGAFYGCSSLTTADFPKAEYIRERAFFGCTSLVTVILPDAAQVRINDGAFSGCASLTTADFPKAVFIGNGAFSGCTSLVTVNLPEAEYISDRAFSGCSSLATVILPDAAQVRISDGAFSGCASLTTADFPKAVFVGNGAFSDCISLVTVNLPEAEYISDRAFSGCTPSTPGTILTITLGPGAPALGINIFKGVGSTGSPRNVEVMTPPGAEGYGSSPVDTSGVNWGNGFRGGGWTGTAFADNNSVNGNVNLIITTTP